MEKQERISMFLEIWPEHHNTVNILPLIHKSETQYNYGVRLYSELDAHVIKWEAR